MSYQPHYISSFEGDSGLDQYYEPFLIPEKAFPNLEDAFCWRGRVKRREGFTYLGRLRRSFSTVSLGVSGGSPWTFNIFTLLAAGFGPFTNETNKEIETAGVTVPDTITNRLTIKIGVITFIDQGDGTLSSVTPGNSGVINYFTGAVTLTHTAGAGVATTISFAYFPGLPVMGLPNNLTNAINEENLRAFDTKYAYEFVAGEFSELAPASPPVQWHGTDYDFFWTISYWPQTASVNKYFWTTNFNNNGASSDPIRYFNGLVWTNFSPEITVDDSMYTARILIPYKDRLLAFNTWEGTTDEGQAAASNFPQRLRYSQIGDPTAATAWRSDSNGLGGFIDVPSDEAIVSVEFIKDVLIVKLERSSWKIIYTGNKVLPFAFEKINTELGAESTFSLVPFDRGVFSVGNVGICTDDSVNVYRIDQKIPQVVFNIKNSDQGPQRVHGIRDFANQVVYWAFPNAAEAQKYPNKVLVYNYINETYAIFNDSFTCYGYYQSPNDLIWSSFTTTTWNDANFTWNSGDQQARYPDIVAGNQQGFVSLLNQRVLNEFSFAITNITLAGDGSVIITSPSHNLQTGSFVKITDILGTGAVGANPTLLNNTIYRVVKIDNDTFNIQFYDGTNFVNETLAVGGTYLAMGRFAYINNISIITKIFSPFYEDNGKGRLGYIDFFTSRTTDGELTCDVSIDETPNISVSDPTVTMSGGLPASGLLGTNVLLTRPENLAIYPYQQNQDKIWHRFYVQAVAQNFQIQLYLSDLQMVNESIVSSEFVLHALALYLSKNARLSP